MYTSQFILNLHADLPEEKPASGAAAAAAAAIN